MVFPDPDVFLSFYIKRRIERDGKLQWYEAPYCREENPPAEWLILEKVAHVFEKDNHQQIQCVMIEQMESARMLNFSNYRKLVQAFVSKMPGRDEKLVGLLALIVFTGLFARRLAELDLLPQSADNMHDYRRGIYQLSIYGSRILLSSIDEVMSDVWVIRVTCAHLGAVVCGLLIGIGAALSFLTFYY
jgi:hypothetical protein